MKNTECGIDYLVESLRKGAELNDELIQKSKQIDESNSDNKLEVEIKDYDKNVHTMMLAIQSVGIRVDYITVDLLSKCMNKYAEKGSEMSLKDSAEIQLNHKKYWDEYFSNLKNKK